MTLTVLLEQLQERLSEVRDDLSSLADKFNRSEVETSKNLAVVQEHITQLLGAVKSVKDEIAEKKKTSTAITVCVIGSLTSVLTAVITLLKK